MELVEVRKAEPGELPITRNTAYKWHSLKKHPQLLYKVGGKLFFDLEEWEAMAKNAKKQHVKKAKEIRQLEI